MRNILRYLAIPIVAGAIFTSCYKDISKEGGYQAPAVRLYTPVATTAVPAKPGQSVTLEGVNLENVASVTVAGVEATITEKTFKKLILVIPTSSEYSSTAVTTTQIVVKSTLNKSGEYVWKKDYYIRLN